MKEIDTWAASIFVGLREGYGDKILPIQKVRDICQEYCDEIGWCITITLTELVYKKGNEPGVIVGVINCPRFPNTIDVLKEKIWTLAELLLTQLKQERLSVVFPDKIVMLEKEDLTCA